MPDESRRLPSESRAIQPAPAQVLGDDSNLLAPREVQAVEACRDLRPSGPGTPRPAATSDPYTTQNNASARPDSAVLPERPSVAGYEVLGELGRGGMGVVYKARQLSLNRLVALKMILVGGHAAVEELARFRTEAEVVARLQHPHIVQVYEVAQQNGLPFFSLELCDGGSLAGRLRRGPLPAREAAALVEKLARAMHTAHQAGVIHRDLKPGNVLLTADGTPKITDFGLARKLDEVGITASGAVMGTPSYMAPEQAAGKVREIGPAADVYALGAILYECLTGRPPFRAATSLDTILQVVGEEPTPPRQLNPEAPRDLEAVCLKCLEKDPRRRYPSALALAEDLACFQAGEAVGALQSGLLDQLVGALDRVQLQAQLAGYGNLMLWLAPVMFLPEIWITVVACQNWPAPLMAVAQFARAIGFLLLVGYFRGWRWRPQGSAERHLWSVWGGYVVACFAMGLSIRCTTGFQDAAQELNFYQPLAALTALAFFSLAGTVWGFCAVIAAAFAALAFVMAIDVRAAPLEFGAAWAAALILFGVRLRRLGRQPASRPGPTAPETA